MSRLSFRAPTALLTAAAILWVPVLAQAQITPVVCQNPVATTTDNRDGYLVNPEEGPVVPMALTADRKELWVANIPDASVTVFSATNPTNLVPVAVVKVALGPVSIVPRPAQPIHEVLEGAVAKAVATPGEIADVEVVEEIWVVCQSSNAVVIVDRASRRVVDSIRLKSEPVGLVFSADGNKAWVSLSASNAVVEINANARTVAATLSFSTPFPDPTSLQVHAEEPRSLLLDGSVLYALSFESGNGTLPILFNILDDPIENLWQFYNPTGTPPIPPPPDRDVLRFAVPGANPASVALWRTGAINFDLEKDDAGELWVSNVDYNNNLPGTQGEFQFGTNNPIARHRVTHAPPLAAGLPAPTTAPPSVDLNSSVLPALAAQGYACSMPNQMAFSADFNALYVACYESHNVAVVDVSGTPQVVAELRGLVTLPTGEHRNFGVRGLVLNAAAGVLYTYSRDNRLQVYTVPVAAGSVNAPVQRVPIGFDITSALAKEGRFVNINSLRAANKVQSCNTCHVDGHLDRIAWNLSDFTGDLPNNPHPRVPKGTKVTMSLRGIEETPPFHWRGDRKDLSAFNPAFQGLLGGTQLSAAEMAAFEAFVFSLSYPANPNQPENRVYSGSSVPPLTGAQAGADAFRCKEAHFIGFDAHPTAPIVKGVSCQFCHGMAGSSGTNNQVNNDVVGLLADDATQLRGLFDKESDIVDYTPYGPPFFTVPPLNLVPATGWGFGNTGSFADTVTNFVNLGVFQSAQLTQPDRDNIVLFLNEFDTGTAPAAAFAWTLNQTSAGSTSQPFNTLLQAQANAGHIDLTARGWMRIGLNARNIGLQYNPRTLVFDSDTTGVGPFSYGQLVTAAGAGNAVLLIMGSPRGTGYRLALDLEMDFAKDGDEPAAGAVVGRADTDADGFADGYEMRLGSNPASALSLPPPDTTPPAYTALPALAWQNASVAKVRWSTNEEATSRIEVHPAGTIVVPPLAVKQDGVFKKDHVLVVRGLPPGNLDFHVQSQDPANPGNVGLQILTVNMQGLDFGSLRLDTPSLAAGGAACGAQVQLTASFRVVDETGTPVPGATVTFDEVEWIPGQGNKLQTGLTTTASNALGFASATFTSSLAACSGATAEVFATAVADPANNKLYFHPLDGQFGFWSQVALP